MSGLLRIVHHQSTLYHVSKLNTTRLFTNSCRWASTGIPKSMKGKITQDMVTGTGDNEADTKEFKYPGQIELNTDKLRDLPLENAEDTLTPVERRQQVLEAARKATNPLSQGLLSLALMPPEIHTDATMEEAKKKVVKELQDAPFWDEADTPYNQLKSMETVVASKKLFNENNSEVAKNVVNKGVIGELEEVEKLKETILEPMPDFSQDFPELSTADFQNINSLAQSLVNSVKVESSAKQPYDTASKVVKARLETMPIDEREFFTLIGTPNEEDRTSLGYLRYLRVIAVKGTLVQALRVWNKLKERGDLLSISYYNEMITCCKRPVGSKEEQEEVLKYMLQNKPNVDKVVHYPQKSPHLKTYTLNPPLPPSEETPYGAPKGFVSAAPTFKTYGTSSRRTRFNPNVELAFSLFETARASGIVPDVKLYSVLIGVCAEHKHVERAFAVFEQMNRQANGEEVDPAYTPTLINRKLMEPLRVTKQLKLKPDAVIATQLMKACWTSSKFYEAEEIFHYFWSTLGITPDAPMYNMMIRIAASTSHVEKAFKYFEQLQHFGGYPSLITYTSLIHACIQPNRPEFYPKAYEVFHECVAAGFRPNEYTFNTLLHACAEQCDLQNGLNVWRLLSSEFAHLRSELSFNTMMRLINRTMDSERLPGYGGIVVVTGSRTLYGPSLKHMSDNSEESKKQFRITREERISMAEALYSEYVLATENKDIAQGKTRHVKLNLNPHFFAELVNVYTKAAVGILRYDRKERDEGREDPHLRITEKMIGQMVQRAWKRVSKLKDDHPSIFDLNEHMYTGLIEMYGAADMLEQAMVHYDYMVKHLNIPVSMKVYNAMLTWAKRNRHQGAAFLIFEKMKENGFAPDLKEVQTFQRMHRVASRKLQDTTYPSFNFAKDAEEMQWNNVRNRNPRTGKKNMHPLDYEVSYKDF